MSGRRAEQALDLAVELLMGVGHAGQIAFLEDRGAEARLGEDHHAGGGLQQMRAGARADDEEERVLHLAVQPDDSGQAAEDLALAALLQDGGVRQPVAGGRGGRFMPALRFEHLSGRPQLPEELPGVDHVGGIGRQRDPHLLIVGPAGQQRPDIGGVQRDDERS
jgi:hypothetical protein